MSKSELKEEKKKRKRQEEEEAVDVPKKSKKSKKTKDTEVAESLVEEEKKSKKPKKDVSSAPEDDTTLAATANAAADTSLQQDFIGLDDEPMPDAFIGEMNGTLSRSDKKAKKDKKEKKSKKVKDAATQEAAKEGPTNGEASTEKIKSKKDKKSKKTKAEPETQEPAQVAELTAASAVDGGASTDKKQKKSKKDKKSKKSGTDEETVDKAAEESSDAMEVDRPAKDGSAAVSTAEEIDTKSKKDRKARKKELKAKKATAKGQGVPETVEESTPAANGAEVKTEDQADEGNGETNGVADAEEEAGKHDRFIVFIGNLPYSATKEQVEEHFAKLKPFEVRLRTYKDTGKFMGCGFIEFERYDHMQTALMKYHHSVFPDPKKKEGRKINVELSAGGGGNTEARVEKIKAKNEKLANERQRNHEKRAEIESKQKERKGKKEAKQTKEGGGDEESAASEPANGGIHPARLAMMQQPQQPEKQYKPNLGNRPKFMGGPPPRPKRY